MRGGLAAYLKQLMVLAFQFEKRRGEVLALPFLKCKLRKK
jgi:hypothetical protein